MSRCSVDRRLWATVAALASPGRLGSVGGRGSEGTGRQYRTPANGRDVPSVIEKNNS
jgi:hypothetical protein